MKHLKTTNIHPASSRASEGRRRVKSYFLDYEAFVKLPPTMKASFVSDLNDLQNSKPNSPSIQDTKSISQTTEAVSKFCQLSKYFDFIQTPFSSLRRSTFRKKSGNVGTNTNGNSDAVTTVVTSVPTNLQTDGGK